MKKFLRPQQTAPVQRETVGTSSVQGANGLVALFDMPIRFPSPFAGDDAE